MMTKEKVLEAINTYRQYFQARGFGKIDFTHTKYNPDRNQTLEHCHGMLDQMEIFVREDKMDKVFRWLGFIQGCLWSHGIYSLEEMKNHNRS